MAALPCTTSQIPEPREHLRNPTWLIDLATTPVSDAAKASPALVGIIVRSGSTGRNGKMKKLLVVIGIWVAFATIAFAQDDSTLEQLIKKTESEATSDRVVAFNSLAKYWDRRQQALAGFSDTPTEATPPKAQQPEITDGNLNKIAEAIERGVNDFDSGVRKAAAIALVSAPRSSDAVQSSILACIKSDDATVNWYVMQQRTDVWPSVDLVIENLIEGLSSQDFNKYYAASDLLRDYGEQARPYSEKIVEAILKGGHHKDRSLKMYVLFDIGLTEGAMRILVKRADELTVEESAIVALSLLEYPDALQLLQVRHPKLIQSLERHDVRLFPFLCKHQYEPHKTRDWLLSAESLPANMMGMLGERRFIEEITKLEANSSNHEKTFLYACKRACGAKADVVVDVDSKHPVDFRPASAWPNSDDRRRGKTAAGHGDGSTDVMVTGEIRAADGSHPKAVGFYRTNDAMLMGTKLDYAEPLMYDQQSGRFVFLTKVFAAYWMGDGQPEAGPYQTGSAQIRVEAPGFKPLVVQFFDELPDVRITLDKED